MSALERFMDKITPEPTSGCWLWTGALGKFYGNFLLDGKYVNHHRASWLLHKGSIPDGLCVCHKCDVYLCGNPDHLFLGTAQENTLDSCKKGRHKAPRKLSMEQARKIRQSTATLEELSAEYGLSISNLSLIRRSKSYKEI